MKNFALILLSILCVGSAWSQTKYDPKEYTIAPEAEIALARSAAPENVTSRATIKILGSSGYKEAVKGDNGFTCIVLRGWSVPFTRKPEYYGKIKAPICYDSVASRTVLPYQELCAKLGLEGKDVETINREVALAYAVGELPKMETTAFAYMWSADQELVPGGHWHPHMMVYAPYYTDEMLGKNDPASMAPFVSPDAGTPFAIVIIPVPEEKAIKAKMPQQKMN